MKTNEMYFAKEGRLAKFKKWTNSSSDWDNLWLENGITKQLGKKITNLGEIEFITKFFSKESKILEAGCGNGWVVQALSLRGFDIEGIDYAENSVTLINKVAPELYVRKGNIFSIDAPDNNYNVYISLGVLEHSPKGPREGLKEAFRVLQPDGLGFFTIPYLNKIRVKKLSHLSNDNNNNLNLSFYQYYFSQAEFSFFLLEAGFDIVDVIPLDIYFGLKEDNTIFSRLEARNFFHWRIKKIIISACQTASSYWKWQFGHILLFIVKKNDYLPPKILLD